MNSLKLAMITRRFWPLVGGAEIVMANLASEFHARGVQTTVITGQWEPDWPREIVHREVPVVRLPHPPQRAWGTLRYMTALGRWLWQHRKQIDLVYVSMLKHDAYAALSVCRRCGIRVVLRAEGGGATGDCQWHETGRFGYRIRGRCLAADAIVAPSDGIERELVAAGFREARVRKIYNGVRAGPSRSTSNQRTARLALSEVNPDLSVPQQAPVAVYTGRLDRRKGLADLVTAWSTIVRDRPKARLWLIGDGPDRHRLYRQVKDLNLRREVLLPGTFDNVDEILQAADLFVLPSYEEGMSVSLLEAMAARLPVVATDIPGNRKLINPGRHGLLVPVRDVQALAAAVEELLRNPDRAAGLAEAACQRVKQDYSLDRAVQQHMQLFGELLTQRPDISPGDHSPDPGKWKGSAP